MCILLNQHQPRCSHFEYALKADEEEEEEEEGVLILAPSIPCIKKSPLAIFWEEPSWIQFLYCVFLRQSLHTLLRYREAAVL